MDALFLCAGYATRLYPLTENFPKPLLPVKGKPVLDYLIEDLSSKGLCDRFIVVSNHKFIDAFKEWKATRPEEILILDDGSISNETRLGAVRDIALAIDSFHIDDDLLVCAGDNLLDFSLEGFCKAFSNKNRSMVMVYEEKDEASLHKRGVAEIEEGTGRVLSMEEKPEHPKSNRCVPPFYIYRKEDLPLIQEGLACGCGVDAPGHFLQWFVTKREVYAHPMEGGRVDIGTLADYLAIRD